ncbi:MAG: hypothetical protein KKC99_06280 [Proteobacteria bacterium]|nr:hypothetical protein [Pseudomonadota bacterium]
MSEQEKTEKQILGVYSHSDKYQYQFGERDSRYRGGTYWFVVKLDEARYQVQPLNAHHLPSGYTKTITAEELLQYYTPEMDYYKENTVPAMDALNEKLTMGRRFFMMGNLSKAEVEFCKAVLMDEVSIDANVGLGEVYAEQQQYGKLREVMDRLMANDDLFKEEQRHQFNTFGISLRKQGLLDDAVRFYRKALEVNDLDEHLHFNIARAYYEKKERELCAEHLFESIRINPNFLEAAQFLDMVEAEE